MDGRVSRVYSTIFTHNTDTGDRIMGMKYYIAQYTGLPYPGPDADAATLAAFVLPGWQQSLLTGILSCGTFFGAIIAGDLADQIGRRWTIISGSIIFSVGCILETASTGLTVMVIGRLIAGAGVGFISAVSKLFNVPNPSGHFTHNSTQSFYTCRRLRQRKSEVPWLPVTNFALPLESLSPTVLFMLHKTGMILDPTVFLLRFSFYGPSSLLEVYVSIPPFLSSRVHNSVIIHVP